MPQFYLRNFGTEIHCFDKKKDVKFKSTPENVAAKSDFYGGEYEGIPSLETVFSQLEGNHAIAMRTLIEKQNYYKLPHEQKLAICEFLAFQYLRTEESRKGITRLTEEAYNLLGAKIIPENLKVKLTEKGSIDMHLKTMTDYRRLAVLFFNMKFAIFLNKTEIPFWTSDNPISKQNEYDTNPYGNLGIVNKGIEIHLPLTPTLCLYALDPTLFCHIPDLQKVLTKQHVIRENFLQLRYSTRFVYSNTNRFHLITSMLKSNPHLRDDSRSDFEVFVGHGKNATYLITSERNDRWPIKNRIMGEMETWVDPDFVDQLNNNKKYDE
ncbi:MAG: DUF4238 domain-containing protein [Patescibacteria group bacterium]|nr:DUF4238 domain-containing protein [Patescibacteria group bacterium]